MTDRQAPNAEGSPAAPPIVVPLLVLLAATIVIEAANLDLVVSGWFYDASVVDVHQHDGWIHAGHHPWEFIDRVGPLVGVALGVVATIVAIASNLSLGWVRWKHLSSFVSLCVLIGPLLLVNVVLKETWGRPRPNTVSAFGGAESHHRIWERGDNPTVHKSFPSGHAAIGFVVLVPAFAFYRRRRDLFRRWLVAGVAFGTTMSAARIVQGSHFVSDVVWSAGLVYLLAAVLYRFVDPEHVEDDTKATSPAVHRLAA